MENLPRCRRVSNFSVILFSVSAGMRWSVSQNLGKASERPRKKLIKWILMKEQISWVVIRACLRCDEFWLAALFFPLQQIRVKIKKKTTHEKEKRIIFKTRQDTRTHATIWACDLWRGKKILFHSPSRCCLLLFFLDVFNKKTAVKNEILCYFLSFLFLDKRSVGDRSCSGAGAYMRMPFRLPQKKRWKKRKKHNIFSLTPHHHLLNIIWIQFDWNHFDKKPVFKYSFFTSRCSFFFFTSRASLTFFFGFLACFLVYCKRVSEWERMEKSRTREPTKKRRTRSEYTLFFLHHHHHHDDRISQLTTPVCGVCPLSSRALLSPPTYYPSLTHSPPSIPPRYPSFWLALARELPSTIEMKSFTKTVEIKNLI